MILRGRESFWIENQRKRGLKKKKKGWCGWGWGRGSRRGRGGGGRHRDASLLPWPSGFHRLLRKFLVSWREKVGLDEFNYLINTLILPLRVLYIVSNYISISKV